MALLKYSSLCFFFLEPHLWVPFVRWALVDPLVQEDLWTLCVRGSHSFRMAPGVLVGRGVRAVPRCRTQDDSDSPLAGPAALWHGRTRSLKETRENHSGDVDKDLPCITLVQTFLMSSSDGVFPWKRAFSLISQRKNKTFSQTHSYPVNRGSRKIHKWYFKVLLPLTRIKKGVNPCVQRSKRLVLQMLIYHCRKRQRILLVYSQLLKL